VDRWGGTEVVFRMGGYLEGWILVVGILSLMGERCRWDVNGKKKARNQKEMEERDVETEEKSKGKLLR
jgi:hypothetical protein